MTHTQENHSADLTTQRRLFWALLLFGVTLFVLFFVVPNFLDVPLRVSKETTLITEPFCPNSQRLDYLAVLQERFAPADPHENGFRMVVQAVGSEPMERASGRTWESICQQLDLNPHDPPTMPGYSKAWAILEQGDSPVRGDVQLDACVKDLWTQEQYPDMDEYLDEISPVLDLMREAVRKDFYFMPQVAHVDWNYALLPCHACNRGFGQGLLARAIRSIRDGQSGAAWQDIDSAMRLGCHLQNGIFRYEWPLGQSILSNAFTAIERLLERCELSEEQLRQCIEDVKQHPKKTVTVEDMALCEQYAVLGAVGYYSNAPRSERKGWKSDIPEWGDKYFGVNWNLVARIVNDSYDQKLQIYRRNLPPADMQRELDNLKDDFKTRCFSGAIVRIASRDARSRQIAFFEFCWETPFVEYDTHIKTGQVRCQLLILAFELEIEKLNNGRYPASLDVLNGRHTPEELTDPFSGGPFEYQPTAEGDGYQLFSKGVRIPGEKIGITIRSEQQPAQ
ncbi:MAG: hypothetical protein FWH27_04330 [Planctomycetaceae bacterium]|nr:hypothetical protein [Planctomycetaceae bacterium]